MAYPLDILFVDGDDRIVDVVLLNPWRICRSKRACAVLEMRAGEADRLKLRIGTRLRLASEQVTDAVRPR